MINGEFRTAYDILVKVYRDGAYLNLIMKENSNKRVAKLVYGVLEHHYELNYIIAALAKRGVKNSVKPALLIAAYMYMYLDAPINAAINECTETLDGLGKGALDGFAVAVLKSLARGEYSLPAKSGRDYNEVKYNMPSWLVGMYKKDYPDTFEQLIFTPEYGRQHIRTNIGTSEKEILDADRDAVKSLTGYFVSNNKEIALLNFLGKITFMSYGSTLIAESVPVEKGKTSLLDLCAAPGGKAVMLAQRGALVTACDVYGHRIELLRSYAGRMKTKIDILLHDATEFTPEWSEKYDVVLVDAPCSGFGVLSKKRDLLFNRTYEDVTALAALQKKILSNAARYVKRGGLLVYSTCTVFKMENGANIADFLANNTNFHKTVINLPRENDGEIQFLPDGKGMEGFYLCQMRKD